MYIALEGRGRHTLEPKLACGELNMMRLAADCGWMGKWPALSRGVVTHKNFGSPGITSLGRKRLGGADLGRRTACAAP